MSAANRFATCEDSLSQLIHFLDHSTLVTCLRVSPLFNDLCVPRVYVSVDFRGDLKTFDGELSEFGLAIDAQRWEWDKSRALKHTQRINVWDHSCELAWPSGANGWGPKLLEADLPLPQLCHVQLCGGCRCAESTRYRFAACRLFQHKPLHSVTHLTIRCFGPHFATGIPLLPTVTHLTLVMRPCQLSEHGADYAALTEHWTNALSDLTIVLWDEQHLFPSPMYAYPEALVPDELRSLDLKRDDNGNASLPVCYECPFRGGTRAQGDYDSQLALLLECFGQYTCVENVKLVNVYGTVVMTRWAPSDIKDQRIIDYENEAMDEALRIFQQSYETGRRRSLLEGRAQAKAKKIEPVSSGDYMRQNEALGGLDDAERQYWDWLVHGDEEQQWVKDWTAKEEFSRAYVEFDV